MTSRYALLAVASLCAACASAKAVLASSPTSAASSEPAVAAPVPAPRDLEGLLRSSPKLAPYVDQAATYRLEILLGVPDPSGSGWLRREGFRVDAEYFYPASAIKLCIAAGALERMTELRTGARPDEPDVDVQALFSSDRRRARVGVSSLVQAALVLSDNAASNDLFDLAGHDGLHERMWRAGLGSVRVRHRLAVPPGEDARTTPRIEIAAPNADPAATPARVLPAREGTVPLGTNTGDGVQVGDSHLTASGQLVEAPMSFEEKNRVSLGDLQDTLVAVMRPDLRAPEEQLRLGEPERALLVDALTALPSRHGAPASADAQHKPMLPGLERVVPRSRLTIASKSGRAYGFVVDNAYVLDSGTGRSFFLTAVVYTNANGRLNDDTYEYAEVAGPFISDLAEVVARSVFVDGP